MKDWHADQVIAIGAVAALLLVVIGADIVAVMNGDMDIMSLGREIVAGLFGYIGRGFVQNFGREQSQTSQALGQIAHTATEAQNIVNTVESIRDIVKKKE